jgi:hypothetical protein
MPDISMCSGNNCKLATLCYRYKAKPNEFGQSYFITPPNKTANECDYFLKIQDKNIYKKSL